jgi:hypothetical protein
MTGLGSGPAPDRGRTVRSLLVSDESGCANGRHLSGNPTCQELTNHCGRTIKSFPEITARFRSLILFSYSRNPSVAAPRFEANVLAKSAPASPQKELFLGT